MPEIILEEEMERITIIQQLELRATAGNQLESIKSSNIGVSAFGVGLQRCD